MFKRILLVIELIDCASDMRLLNFKLNCIEKKITAATDIEEEF